MLQRIKSKKGFTLAELLIVVAIIAVLTAIAVPLFVNALNDSETKVGNANIRAVRAEATSKILFDQQNSTHDYGDGPWYVRAVVTGGGAISKLEITSTAPIGTDTNKDKYQEQGTAEKQDDGYIIYLKLVEVTPDKTLTAGE